MELKEILNLLRGLTTEEARAKLADLISKGEITPETFQKLMGMGWFSFEALQDILKLPSPEGLTSAEYSEALITRLNELRDTKFITYEQGIGIIDQLTPTIQTKVTEEEEVRAGKIDIYRYTEGLREYVWDMVGAGQMSSWDARKIIADAKYRAETEGISPDLPYWKEVEAGLPYAVPPVEAEYAKNVRFYNWLATQPGFEGKTGMETAKAYAGWEPTQQAAAFDRYEAYAPPPTPEEEAKQKEIEEMEAFLKARKPSPWYEGEEQVPIEGRPETLEAYKERTQGLAYLNGKWVPIGTSGAKTPEELGWLAPIRKEEPVEPRTYRYTGEMPPEKGALRYPTTKEYYPFLEGLPKEAREYYEPRLGQIYAEFEREFPGAREQWWGRAQRPFARQEELGELQALQAKAIRVGGATRESVRRIEELGAVLEAEPYERGDPFALFLKEYPFLQKYQEALPGMYRPRAGRYAPPTRWLSY